MKEIIKDPQKIERIMSASIRLFAKNRYQRTKVDEIASEAEVSKGIIFRYFQNKTNLYLETLKHAIENISQNIDYGVWTDSDSMSELIVRATAYKIKLQMKFPQEFKLLLDAYANANDFSKEMNEQVQKVYVMNMQDTTELIKPVLNRLELRDDVTLEDALRLMNAVILQITEESKQFVYDHPDGELTDMTEIIAHAKTYVEAVERGITKG
jgi:TetR/AcrR family transcriptional regulator